MSKPFVFVLMPFDSDFDDIYQLGIKDACSLSGAYCERVDEQIFEESILERIYNQISKADIVIADMTKRNPNVFYETGYAHAFAKRVILLTQNSDDIPFDLKHYPHIIYEGKISYLKDELIKRITWAIENPEKSINTISPELKYYVDGNSLQEGGKAPILEKYVNRMRISDFKLDIFNPTNKIYNANNIKIGLETSYFNGSNRSQYIVNLPDGKYIHFFQNVGEIFPSSWASVSIELKFHNLDQYRVFESMGESTFLHIYTEIGKEKIPIQLYKKGLYWMPIE